MALKILTAVVFLGWALFTYWLTQRLLDARAENEFWRQEMQGLLEDLGEGSVLDQVESIQGQVERIQERGDQLQQILAGARQRIADTIRQLDEALGVKGE